MPFDAVLQYAGVLVVALGAAVEGEMAVVTGGVLARSGLFSPWAAALAAWAGAFAADQALFRLARWRRHSPFVVRVTQRRTFAKALALIDRHPVRFTLGFRFLYGARIVGPIALGLSSVPYRSYLALNLASSVTWASLYTLLGYSFGPAVRDALYGLLSPKLAMVLALMAMAAGAVIWHRRSRRQARSRS